MARTFAMSKPALKNHYTITGPSRDDPSKEESIFSKTSGLVTKPYVIMYDGPDSKCPVAAVSHLPAFARHFTVGLGDPAVAEKQLKPMAWEELHMAGASGKKHTWAMDVEDGAASGRRRRIRLVWTRTRSVTVEGMTRSPLSTRNWKLTELPASGGEQDCGGDGGKEGEEPILAVFTSGSRIGQCGKMQVNVDYGRDFDIMLFVTCLSLYASGR
ncbi:hypothetical protein PWT90_01609 [Aphanocladium album]|nr:hypothetical protein PWT90_01609 [Aphanocladium album]